jgi:hypothetical protein
MRFTHLITAGALVCCFSGVARAGEPDEADKREARELMARGRQARDNADSRAALDAFEEADAIMHVPTTGLEVARALVALGKLVEAADKARSISELGELPDEPEAFGKARQGAKALELELETRIPTLHINLSVPADSVHLSLDGKPLPVASEMLRVNPGRHVLLAEHAGTTREHTVNVVEGAARKVTFNFGELAPQAASSSQGAKHAPGASPVVYGLTGIAVLGIGAGIGLGLWGNHERSNLERNCAPDCEPSQVDTLRHTYIAANVAAAVGAAAGVGAIALYFTQSSSTPKRRAQSSLSLVANAGGQSGVSLAGSF